MTAQMLRLPPVLPMIGPHTPIWGPRTSLLTGGSTPSSATYESANRAVYYPIQIYAPCVAKRMWVVNGSTVNASYTWDLGIYRDNGYKPGAKLVSTGATAQGTATEVQFIDITDTGLTPGLWWFAIVGSSDVMTGWTSTGSIVFDASYRFEEASASPLPSTATPVESSSTNIWLFGFSTTTIT